MHGLLIHPGELTKKWIDRMADAGVRVLGLHPEGGKQAIDSLNNLLRLLETEEYRALIDYAIDVRGLEIEYEFHAAGWLLSRELFDTHPEYFRMDENGERVREIDFCLSNTEAIDVIAENAAALAKRLYRSAPRYYFWLDDNSKPCGCELCRAISPSDAQLKVMNAIVTRLRRDDPSATLAYLAYQNFIVPPKTVKPADGIFLEFAPIKRDMNRPASEGAELDNVRELLAVFGTQNSKVLEYWYDNSLFSKWKKPPKQFKANNELIRGDLDFYCRLGFEVIASFACFLGDDYEELWGDVDIGAFGE
ncbi:MAG: DUF4838 domain-containing protein [Clostridia bacterium]|nr:DUF4838 domain-containing protein [Clostridia bacterium]MBQ8552560.1 DUF4838 domain-containing protein [Clostridia bacterium]